MVELEKRLKAIKDRLEDFDIEADQIVDFFTDDGPAASLGIPAIDVVVTVHVSSPFTFHVAHVDSNELFVFNFPMQVIYHILKFNKEVY